MAVAETNRNSGTARGRVACGTGDAICGALSDTVVTKVSSWPTGPPGQHAAALVRRGLADRIAEGAGDTRAGDQALSLTRRPLPAMYMTGEVTVSEAIVAKPDTAPPAVAAAGGAAAAAGSATTGRRLSYSSSQDCSSEACALASSVKHSSATACTFNRMRSKSAQSCTLVLKSGPEPLLESVGNEADVAPREALGPALLPQPPPAQGPPAASACAGGGVPAAGAKRAKAGCTTAPRTTGGEAARAE